MSVVTDTTNHENGGGAGNGQPQGLPLQQVCRSLFSEESLMSVVTDTTNHENGSRGDSRIAPTGDWTGVIFRGMTGAGVIEGSPKAGASSLYLSPGEGEILAACRVVADTLHGPVIGAQRCTGRTLHPHPNPLPANGRGGYAKASESGSGERGTEPSSQTGHRLN